MSEDASKKLAQLFRFARRGKWKQFLISGIATALLTVATGLLSLSIPSIHHFFTRAIDTTSCFLRPVKSRNTDALVSITLTKLANDDSNLDETATVRRWLRSALNGPLVAGLVQLRDDCRSLNSAPSESFDAEEATEQEGLTRSQKLQTDMFISGEVIQTGDSKQPNRYVELMMMVNGLGEPIRQSRIYRIEDGVSLEKQFAADFARLLGTFLLQGVQSGDGWIGEYSGGNGYGSYADQIDFYPDPWYCKGLSNSTVLNKLRELLGGHSCTVAPTSIDYTRDSAPTGGSGEWVTVGVYDVYDYSFPDYALRGFCHTGSVKEKLACQAQLLGSVQDIGRLPILSEGLPLCYIDSALAALSSRLQVLSPSYLIEATERFRKITELPECKADQDLFDHALAQFSLSLDLLARQQHRTEGYEAIVDNYRRALLSPTLRAQDPLLWAALNHNLGLVLIFVAERDKNLERLKEAENVLQLAIDVYREANQKGPLKSAVASLTAVKTLRAKAPTQPLSDSWISEIIREYSRQLPLFYSSPTKPRVVQKQIFGTTPKL